ncbi:MAG: hypothetical protein QW324_06280 [Thermofilaceae archaeon]
MASALVRVLVVLLVTLLLFTAAASASSVGSKPVFAEVYPAPIGYVFVFPSPHPSYIYGFRSVTGVYTPHRAAIAGTSTYVAFVDHPVHVHTIVHNEGASELRRVESDLIRTAYGVILPGPRNDVVLFGGGLVYTSPYTIHYNVALDHAPNTVLVTENLIDLTLDRVIKVLAVTSDSPITLVLGSFYFTGRLTDILGVHEACVAWFRDRPPDFPWVGGLVISPACTRNVAVLRTVEYAGRPFAVVFRVTEVPRFGGSIDYVVMGTPTARVLQEAGLIAPVRPQMRYAHFVTGLELERLRVYVAFNENSYVRPGEVVAARNVTQVVGRSRYICPVPAAAQVVYRLTWNSRELKGSVEILPGEFVLYEYMGEYYVCIGDLSWMEHADLPLVKGPAYRELLHSVHVYTSSGRPVLAVSANGRIYYGASFEIPFSEVQANAIYWFVGSYAAPIEVSPSTIVASPFFALFLLLVFVLVGVVVFGRGRSEPERISLIWDVKLPPPLSLASEATLKEIVRKHVDAFGVCPDVVDLALYHEVLPPIPRDATPEGESLICPFATNPRTESVLRRLNELLTCSLWGIKRMWSSRGVIYTIVGDEMLYVYFYKQENEEAPEQIIANALESVVRSRRFDTVYFRRPLGLVIVVEPSMLPLVKRELSILEELSLAPELTEDEEEEGASRAYTYRISEYLATRGVKTTISAEVIQEAVDRDVPRILVISEGNIDELIEYLSEKHADLGTARLRRILGE